MASLGCGLKGHSANASNLGFVVDHGVKALTVAVVEASNTTRLTKINITGKLTDNKNVHTRDDLGFEG